MMADGGIGLVSTVPMLKGSENYQAWRVHLRNALCARDLRLWQVASGEYALESRELMILAPAQIRTKAAAHFHLSDETALNDEQIAQWTKEFIDTPNEELIEWGKLDATALHLIKITIHRHIIHSIKHEVHASNVMRRLHFQFDTLPKGPYLARYDNYISYTYKVGMDPTLFCRRFRELLADMDEIGGARHRTPPMQAYCQFMAAVRAYGYDMLPWLNSQNQNSPDMDSDDMLDKAIQSFLNYESYRNRRNAA